MKKKWSGEFMKILHICDGWEEWNGAANIARLIGNEQSVAGHQVLYRRFAAFKELKFADEVWVHCGWKPCLWWAAMVAGKKAKWMPEACYDPVRLNYHGWKKWLVGPIERFCLRRCKSLVATCDAEKRWIEEYLGKDCPPIEVEDVKRFFNLGNRAVPNFHGKHLHVLYLGRQHPLKGVEFLEQAVKELNTAIVPLSLKIDLHIVSNKFGVEKEAEWNWCDVLCLPTLSDNLGLVIAEAIERSKFVITTDGAPAWREYFAANPDQGIYIEGYRNGTKLERVEELKRALGETGWRLKVG